MTIYTAKPNHFHIDKTINNYSHLNNKNNLLAYYLQINEKMVVG